MTETRSEAVAQYESHVDLLTGLELGGLASQSQATLPGIGPLRPRAGKGGAAQERLRMEEQRRTLLHVDSLPPERQNGEIEQSRNIIFPKFTNQISHSSTRREEVRV